MMGMMGRLVCDWWFIMRELTPEQLETLVRLATEAEAFEAMDGMEVAGAGRSAGVNVGGAHSFAAAVKERNARGARDGNAARAREVGRVSIWIGGMGRGGWWRGMVATAAVLLLGGYLIRLAAPLMSGGGSGAGRVAVVPRLSNGGGGGGEVGAVAGVGGAGMGGADRFEEAGREQAIGGGLAGGEGAAGEGVGSEGFNGIGSRILVLSLDRENDCRCAQSLLVVREPGQAMGEVTRAELLALGFESSCLATPDRIMVVSVTGLMDELPTSDAEMAAMALCVDDVPADADIGELGHDEVKYKSALMACISYGLKVEVATLLAK